MNAKNTLHAAIFMLAISTLLVGQVFASQIYIFAPLNYTGVPPSYPTPFKFWGNWAVNGGGFIDEYTGDTALTANPGAAGYGYAISWFDTGWLFYSGADQGGSVHGDIELSGTINGWGAGFRVYLWVVRWQPGSLLQFWVKMWTYAIPGSINTAVDLGISPWDRSLPGGLPFQWVSGFFYYTRVIIQAFASSNTQASCDARFDDILWSTYTSSLEPHWIHSSDPEIALDPPMGPVETRVDIVGTGFAPESIVYVYFDDNLVAESLTTPEGVFKSWFNVPSQSRKGPHTLRAIDQLENSGISFFDVFIEAPPVAGDLNGDGVVNINDASLVGINWLKADPNVDPPEEASATDIFPSASGFALIAIVAIGFLKLRKKLGRLVS